MAMAWTLINLHAATFFLLLRSYSSQSPPLLLPPSHPHARPAMVLPLFPSPKNSSNSSRRLLSSDDFNSSHPNARMRLYDNLLSRGYYSTRLWIGTPPQKFALIVDTGSTVTYVPCSNCENCGKHEDPKFQPVLSSTFKPLKCSLDCICDKDRNQCVYERQYAELSITRGILVNDVISFGNLSELSPQRAVFGCETEETGDLYTQHADGIIGLGRGELSIVDQLVEKAVISDSFSLCYGGMDVGGGAMVLGGISAPSDMVFTHSDPERSPYYNIDLKSIHVAGKKLYLNPSVFDGKFGTVLDSGTTYAYLPKEVFTVFKETILKELKDLKQISGPVENYNDICFSGVSSEVSKLSKVFPTVELVFENKKNISLSPENYLFRHSKVKGAYCLGIFQNGADPTTLLGGIVVRNTLVTYDREHSKVGFWKTNCSELWERLHYVTGAPAPSPSSSSGKHNSTVERPPTLAPEGPPSFALPGELEIGEISLDMAVNVNYSYLKPRLNVLFDFMAKELDLNRSQVHLLKLTSEGNSSLVRWTIVPSGVATYITNVTAIKILSRLVEQRVKLPDSFGHYKLVQWKVKPYLQQRWWEKHHLGVLSGIIMLMVVGLLASGIWLWRRREQTPVPYPYQPVDEAAREQELQPLQSSSEIKYYFLSNRFGFGVWILHPIQIHWSTILLD